MTTKSVTTAAVTIACKVCDEQRKRHVAYLTLYPCCSQTLPLDASRGLWGWLAPIHKSGASLVRGSLVARCIADPKLLAWLGDTARRLGSQSEWPGSVFLTFYATVMSEIVTSTKV